MTPSYKFVVEGSAYGVPGRGSTRLPGSQHKVSPDARANCHGLLCPLPLEGEGHGASGVRGLPPP